jgi:hypothetical protein
MRGRHVVAALEPLSHLHFASRRDASGQKTSNGQCDVGQQMGGTRLYARYILPLSGPRPPLLSSWYPFFFPPSSSYYAAASLIEAPHIYRTLLISIGLLPVN